MRPELIESLRASLADLSNEKVQREAWVQGACFLPDYNELVCQVFDDTGLSEALKTGTADAALGTRCTSLLRELSTVVDSVQVDRPCVEVVDSPELMRVRAVAAAALIAMPER